MKRTECKGLDPHCGRSCSQNQLTYLMTRLAWVEGDILELVEHHGDLTVRRLMEILEWEPCAVAMAAGSLIRQGYIRSIENGDEVYLEFIERADAL